MSNAARVIVQFPHCDQRILHAPGECEYCDRHSDWQALREAWRIAFTGKSRHLLAAPTVRECTRPYPHQCTVNGPCNGWPRGTATLPCPADFARPPGAANDHRRWGGNKPTGARGDSSWPAETPASVVFYGDMGGRSELRQGIVAAILRLLRGT